MKYLLLLLISFYLSFAHADAVIFSGNDVKALKYNLDLFGRSKLMGLNIDPRSGGGITAPLGSIGMDYLTGNVYVKTSGPDTGWVSLAGATIGSPNTFAGYDSAGNLGSIDSNANLNWDVTNKILHIPNGEIDVQQSTTDVGTAAGEFSATSHTTTNGSNTTIGITGVAVGTIDVGADNDKTVSGMNFAVTRGDTTDAGVLNNLTGASTLLFDNSDPSGLNNEAVNFDGNYFATQGTTTNVYGFRYETVPSGTGVITNYTGMQLGNSVPVNQYKAINLDNSEAVATSFFTIAATNSHSIGTDYEGINVVNSGNVTGSMTGLTLNNSGTVGNGVRYENFNNSGAVTGDLFGYSIQNQSGATVSGNFHGLDSNNQAAIAGDHFGVNIFNSGTVTGNSFGMAVSDNADSGSFSGVSIVKNGNTTLGTMEGVQVTLNGNSATSITGQEIDLESSNATLNLVGLDINMQSATAGNSAVSIETSGGVLGISSQDVIKPAVGFQQGNSIGVFASTTADVTNTAYIANFLLTGLNFNDNVALDGFGIGINQVGYVGSINVASGKTVARMNGVVSGWSQSGGSGTITDTAAYLAAGNLGGAGIVVTNQYGLEVLNGFSAGAANTWGVSIEDATTKNYFAGETDFGTKIALQNSGFQVNILPPTLAASYSLTLPVDDGTPNQVLQTDGSGVLSWSTITTGITTLTGDVTAGPGSGSVASTVAKIQGTVVSGTTGSTNVVFSSAPTLSNPVVGTQSVADNSTKAASTAYVTTAVNNAVSGINPAVAVQAATTSAANTSGFTYNNGVSGIGATFTGSVNTAVTIDGFTFTTLGQRLLVKNDTQSPSGAFNGVYYVTQVQTAILAPILTRALDYDMPSDINNTGAIPVINGTINGTTSWVLTSAINTVGTDPLTFTQFTRNPSDYLLKANDTQETPSGLINSSNVTFTLANTPGTSASVILSQDGLTLTQGAGKDYTISGATITMAVAPSTGQSLWAKYSK